ncbi:MAG: RluA family pseudouridine synthase [Gudongella sp.]|nr:RluA family pseudouridine synthase [Gudongella sp.]
MSNFIEFKNELDRIILEEFLNTQNISGRMFRKLLKGGKIKVNEKVAKNKKESLNSGDIVRLSISDESIDIEPQNISIEILYEDEDILAVNKEPFIIVHPTTNVIDKTLSNAVAYYFLENNIHSKVRIINRLDRDTSGVILFAKNTFGHQQIARQLENNTAIKTYYAVVEGILKTKEDIINKAIGKNEDGLGQCIRPDGSESITKYRVVEEYKNSSLLELEILTGRTHQIRVHLLDLGHPVIGDTLYNKDCKDIKRQALHAYSIKLKKTREQEIITIVASLPNDILHLINTLRAE